MPACLVGAAPVAVAAHARTVTVIGSVRKVIVGIRALAAVAVAAIALGAAVFAAPPDSKPAP